MFKFVIFGAELLFVSMPISEYLIFIFEIGRALEVEISIPLYAYEIIVFEILPDEPKLNIIHSNQQKKGAPAPPIEGPQAPESFIEVIMTLFS